MFQFTTTHVINDNSVFAALAKDGKEGTDLFQVKGVNNFKSEGIVGAFKAAHTPSENAQLVIDLSGKGSKGDTLRLSLYVRLTTADNSSYYANETQYKGRPFTVEFPVLDTAEKTAKNLEKIIKKYGLLVFEKEILKVSVSGAVITLDAVNEFQRFHTAKLEKFVESTNPFADNWEVLVSLEDESESLKVAKEGVEGFGDYGWILRNLKLPTHEHTRAFAPKANEMPIPGATYNQYTIHYCADRGPLGMNAVGQNVQSVTTHVLYVNTNVVEAFESAFKSVHNKAFELVAPKVADQTSEAED